MPKGLAGNAQSHTALSLGPPLTPHVEWRMMPTPSPTPPPQVQEMLGEAQMSGLTDIIMKGIEGLAGQAAPSGSALNDKFQKTGKFMMVRDPLRSS